MCQSGLVNALRELSNTRVIVLLPAGSDEFVKYTVNKCINIEPWNYDIDDLRYKYKELFNRDD